LATTGPDGDRIEEQLIMGGTSSDQLLFAGRVRSRLDVQLVVTLSRAFRVDRVESIFVNVPDKTRAFLARLDPARYERRGSDYASPRYAHGDLLTRPDFDPARSYDFELVRDVERRLLGVDRRRVLAALFARLVGGLQDPTARHLAVLRFLHKSGFNHIAQPLYPDGHGVSDPLVLLELGDMRCGQVNRVGVDLFDAVGVPGRIVQFGSHQGAEVQYGGRWHYLDGDIFGNGEAPRNPEGMIPSVIELSRTPSAVDGLAHNQELYYGALGHGSWKYPSWFLFNKAAYEESRVVSSYYVRIAPEDRRLGRDYGWESLRTIPDSDRVLNDGEAKYFPGAVPIASVWVLRHAGAARASIRVTWQPADDQDHDLRGYRVFVASESRGWCYGSFLGAPAARPYWRDCGGWRPSMYEGLFRVPPHDVALVTTRTPSVRLSLPTGRDYFVTIMPFDAYGESLGKRIYPMSSELHFKLSHVEGRDPVRPNR
jgi:hypothetical protein